ncbi:SRPBCC domain-containing protein [Georgenia alba]|uniref:SRPBCC domain-containing protein n=1 Tax=Georgenia alba TaxID=2233858 RepID=A0ABW2QGZ0_9MICO
MTATTGPLGEVIRDGNRTGLRYVRLLKHPPERVWRALTESEDLRHWFPADIVGDRVPGAHLDLPFWPEALEQAETTEAVEAMGVDPDDHVSAGELRVWDPPRTFELTWGVDGRADLTDLLRFELEPAEEGTRLTFTTWLGGSEAPDASGGDSSDTATGWHVCLDELADLLDEGPTSPTEQAAAVVAQRVKDRTAHLGPRYAAMLSS